MLKSMTGFGKAEQTVNDKTFLVEIKALNGKQLELQIKLPPLLRPYEFDIRNIVQEHLVRAQSTVCSPLNKTAPHARLILIPI
jgi:uncharacterized protein (TIGR00255 family)